ncbi:MAG TPA: sigma-70 family RNA polymerase sigma factor [Polyangiaceae bacterium]|nr:sigma-70 family RNA polymerase sigma factor [Polyangiaceae bacterium]
MPSSGDDYCNPQVLVRLVRAGGSEALDRLTRCYGDRLFRAGQRHCRTRAEAEDAVQDTWFHAVQHLEDFRGEGSLEGWLVRIVATACRRQARGRKNADHVRDTTLVSADPSPLEVSAARQVAQNLQTALLGLSEHDRAIVLLAEVEDWSAGEIGVELGLTEGAVRARLSRARAGLRRAISGNDLNDL